MNRLDWGVGPAGPEESAVGEWGWGKPPPWRGFVVGLLSGLFSITVCSWPSVPYEPLAGTIAMMSGSVKKRMMMMMIVKLVLTGSTDDFMV